jgi:hypothetical protein
MSSSEAEGVVRKCFDEDILVKIAAPHAFDRRRQDPPPVLGLFPVLAPFAVLSRWGTRRPCFSSGVYFSANLAVLVPVCGWVTVAVVGGEHSV